MIAPERIVIPSDELRLHHSELYNPLEPPEPSALARRLEALSAESSPLSEESPTSASTTTSPERMDATLIEQSVSPLYSTSASSHQPGDEFVVVDSAVNVTDPVQSILSCNIKGLYQLWKLGRQDKSVENDKEVFMTIVQQALSQL